MNVNRGGWIAGLALVLSSAGCALAWSGSGDTAQARGMHSGDFVSPDDPPLRLRPDASWRYLGAADFDLEQVAHVERHHFVVADGARLERMLVLQFESILPGVDGFYRWEIQTPRELAGIPYQFNVFAFDADEAARERPGAEVAHTAQFLREHGLTIDRKSVV